MQLIDSYNRKHSYLRISVTDRCNLRCFYCLPSNDEEIDWKPKNKLLTFEEMETLSRIFISLGVDKIRITGGEPLVRNGLPIFLEKLGKLKSIGLKTLAMTTNGLLLANHAESLFKAGVTHLNISVDSLQPQRFEKITGRDHLADVLKGIKAAIDCGFPSIKLNVVIIAGVNDDEVLDIIEYAQQAQKQSSINVRFIEFMPFVGNGWNIEKVIPYTQILKQIESKYQLTPLLTEPSAVAKDFAINDFSTSVSFITSMTESFCSTCNRLRLTADGSIKPCLFDPSEISLRDLLRSGASTNTIEKTILDALKLKPEAHDPAEELAADHKNRSMIQIGG
ncbi:MAG: GTP 3',8-cyclase MoaA [Candidatus Melainabacteria bacterium]|nr:MAG: GTP 3',8-cyclase MoaA [Candidatus Melainabacteria bacterium]